jgi:hypothetical protein
MFLQSFGWKVCSTDLLCDTTCFACLHVSSSEFIQNKSLTSIDMAKNTDDRTSKLFNLFFLGLLRSDNFLLSFLSKSQSSLLSQLAPLFFGKREDISPNSLLLLFFSLFHSLLYFVLFFCVLSLCVLSLFIIMLIFLVFPWGFGDSISSCLNFFSGKLLGHIINISIIPVIYYIFILLRVIIFCFLCSLSC